MDRSKFPASASIGAAATTRTAPAIAQDVRDWESVSLAQDPDWPLCRSAYVADRITTLSGGRINVTRQAIGEIMPAMARCLVPASGGSGRE